MASHDSGEETTPEEQPKVTQSHGVSEYYLNIEATSEAGGGEMAMLSHSQLQEQPLPS